LEDPAVTSVADAIDARDYAVKGVSDYLGQLEETSLVGLLGSPRELLRFAEAAPSSDPAANWHIGDGRPALADDDPAVMQAMGRCAVARQRGVLGVPVVRGAIHGVPCGWCDYPLAEVLRALGWAVWRSRYVLARLLVWDGLNGSVYVRSRPTGAYLEPSWAVFFGRPRAEREHLIRRVIEANAP
jgi:hypothetical protein